MTDFREQLYRRYVTTFKKYQLKPDEGSLRSYWAWAEHKYLSLFNDVDRSAPILELGCGPGYFMGFLQNKSFSNVIGIDISEEQVQLACERGLNAQVADVFDFLASNKDVFEVIIGIDFVEHFTKEELTQLFSMVHAALRKRGKLIIETPNGQGLLPNQVIYGDLTHVTVFTPGSLAQILSLTGFDGIEFRETGPVPKNVKGRIRLVLWKLIKVAAKTVQRIETGKSQEIWTENMICCCRKS